MARANDRHFADTQQPGRLVPIVTGDDLAGLVDHDGRHETKRLDALRDQVDLFKRMRMCVARRQLGQLTFDDPQR